MKVDSPWGPGETREGVLGCSGVRSPGSAFFTGRWWASACGVLGEEHFGDVGWDILYYFNKWSSCKAGCVLHTLLLFSLQVMSDFLWSHGLQHTRPPPHPSPALRVCRVHVHWVGQYEPWSNTCPLGFYLQRRMCMLAFYMSWWGHHVLWALAQFASGILEKHSCPEGSTLGGLAGLVGVGPRLNPLLSLLDPYLWMGSRVHLTLGWESLFIRVIAIKMYHIQN